MRKLLVLFFIVSLHLSAEGIEQTLSNGVRVELYSHEWSSISLGVLVDRDDEILQQMHDYVRDPEVAGRLAEIGNRPDWVLHIGEDLIGLYVEVTNPEDLDEGLEILANFANNYLLPEAVQVLAQGDLDEEVMIPLIDNYFNPQVVSSKRIPIPTKEEVRKDSTFLRAGFSNKFAKALHTFGDWLNEPWSWGVRKVVSVTDPHLPEIHEAMGQKESKTSENIRKIRDGAVGGFVAVISTPFAALGQGLKIVANAWAKESTVREAGEKSGIVYNFDVDWQIMSWNVAAMPSIIRRVNQTRPADIRMDEIGEYLNNGPWRMAIVFQECFTDRAQTALYNHLKAKYPFAVHHVGQNVIGLNSGLMALSPFEIVEDRFEVFDNRRGEDKFAQKGVLGLVLKLDENTYGAIVTSHAEAGGLGHENVSTDSLRTVQIGRCHQMLLDLQQWIRDQGKVVAFGVLTGDLNQERDLADFDGGTDEEKVRLQQVLDQYIPMERTGPTTRGNLVTYQMPHDDAEMLARDGNRKGRTRIDYADVLKGSKVLNPRIKVLYETGTMSDHFPVELTFQRAP